MEIAEADELLGRRFPLPTTSLPLARWVEIEPVAGGAEVEWNLDDSRGAAPGRLALYAGGEPPPEQLPTTEPEDHGGIALRRAPLPEAQPSLRPVTELRWSQDGLHLRLTAQGPWDEAGLLALARGVRG